MAENQKPANSGNDTALNKATEEEFEIVESPIPTEKEASAKGSEDDDDEAEAESSDDGDEGGDTRLSSEATDDEDERERIRRNRRKERQQRKNRINEAFQHRDRQIAELSNAFNEAMQRIAQMEAAQSNTRAETLQQQQARAESAYKAAEQRIAEATRLGDGEGIIAALRQRDAASAEWHRLNGLKGQAQPAVQEQVKRAAAPQSDVPKLTERGQNYANDFLAQNKWINPNGNDDDNHAVREIDAQLVKEGLNPNTKAYWSEFNERLRDELPHRFRQANERRGPPVGSGREHVPNSTRKQVYVSPERKKAMQEVGAWDDPVKRKAYLAAYAEYDRNNASRN